MPDSSSFIPKRNPGQSTKSVRRYNFFLLTIISYALFAAAPLASAALFIYERHTENQFNKAVTDLDQAISNFSETDLNHVIVFDKRLQIAKQLMGSHISILSLLKILENATADTVQFDSLDVKRSSQSSLTVHADLETPSLDGVLFQRSVYNTNTLIASSSLGGIKLVEASSSATSVISSGVKSVKLVAEFNFDADKILYTPLTAIDNSSPLQSSQPLSGTSSASTNANNI